MEYDLTVSIVLFNTKVQDLKNVLKILEQSRLNIKIYLVDNSPEPLLKEHIPKIKMVEYLFTGKNLGYGGGHNVAINLSVNYSKCHLVLNSDVDFKVDILEVLYNFIESNDDVGVLGPKVLNLDGTHQYSAKLLPTPANLIVRRFIPLKFLKDKMNFNYELRFFNFNKVVNVPYLSGCFMFINCEALKKVKGFDETFFMYPEDIDLTRRMHEDYKTLYFPEVTIKHEHGKASYKDNKLLYYHITSMIKYFNKWGWFFDKDRRKINKKTLQQFN